ncbi:AMP-binding protein [Brevibacterium sp. UMB10442]|nr:AMP-binding protein [Brevibacterium sp. UMB10442]
MVKTTGKPLTQEARVKSDQLVQEWLETYDAPDANASYLLCDRHDSQATAFTFIAHDGTVSKLTYGELSDRSKRLATALKQQGVEKGDRVGVLLTKCPDMPITLLALARLGAVYVPLFTAFATGAIKVRMEGAKAKLVITEPSQEDKVKPLDWLNVITIGEDYNRMQTEPDPLEDSVALGGDGTLVQLFTSGTTGNPKGVAVPVRALASFHCYMHYSLDVRPEDVFWNAADPGWAYGLYYGVLGPLAIGLPNLMQQDKFTADSTLQLMRDHGVTNYASAPTVYRTLSKSGLEPGFTLRRASSAGEPLTVDVIDWAKEKLGTEVYDQYGQTELGMVICNQWNDEVREELKPGSMGKPIAGYEADILDGQIVISVPNSPLLWFTGYQDDPQKSAERFSEDGKWYLTADAGYKDEDGSFFFEGRDDDVILMAGYRIGPFDVESVLITHPDVVDVGVVGKPDRDGVRGELAEAYVVLREGVEATPELAEELKLLVKEGYSAHAYPRKVHFVDALPKTPSGKLRRGELRKRED